MNTELKVCYYALWHAIVTMALLALVVTGAPSR
jgi:hypothetical protein